MTRHCKKRSDVRGDKTQSLFAGVIASTFPMNIRGTARPFFHSLALAFSYVFSNTDSFGANTIIRALKWVVWCRSDRGQANDEKRKADEKGGEAKVPRRRSKRTNKISRNYLRVFRFGFVFGVRFAFPRCAFISRRMACRVSTSRRLNPCCL